MYLSSKFFLVLLFQIKIFLLGKNIYILMQAI